MEWYSTGAVMALAVLLLAQCAVYKAHPRGSRQRWLADTALGFFYFGSFLLFLALEIPSRPWKIALLVYLALHAVIYLVLNSVLPAGSSELQTAEDTLCCWRDVFRGRGYMAYRVLFGPVLLVVHSCRIYGGHIMIVYLERLYWRLFGCCSDYFTDVDFPPCEKSLGSVTGDAARGAAGSSRAEIIWVRAGDFGREDINDRPSHPTLYNSVMSLYEGEIEANDIRQGTLGDCWLLAAMACLAEHPGMINKLFLNRELEPSGKYRVRLFDVKAKEWTVVTVDDFVPCQKDTGRFSKDGVLRRNGEPLPLYAKPHNREIWAMILEKAVAKLMGSYQALEGGFTELGVVYLTGRPAWRYNVSSTTPREWRRSDLEMYKSEDGKFVPIPKFELKADSILQDDEGLFKILEIYSRHGSLLCCGGVGPAGEAMGLVAKHAYSLLQVTRVGERGPLDQSMRRFVKIRNPWGDGEWKGRWSDGDAEWERYPRIKEALGWAQRDDGIFWMEWEDFCSHWTRIGVIDCPLDIFTVAMPPYDNSKRFGPFEGLKRGCWDYWCGCVGPRRFFLSHTGKMQKITLQDAEDQQWGCDPSGCFCHICDRFVRSSDGHR